MRAVAQLAPLAIGLVVFGGIVAFTLQRNMSVGIWLLAGFLVAHGLVHVMFAAPPPATAGTPGAEFAFDVQRSWPVTSGLLHPGVVRALVLALVVAVVIGYALAGAATVGIFVSQTWWPALVIGATSASAALMLIGLSPGLALGIAIDIVLVWMVVARTWSPAPAA